MFYCSCCGNFKFLYQTDTYMVLCQPLKLIGNQKDLNCVNRHPKQVVTLQSNVGPYGSCSIHLNRRLWGSYRIADSVVRQHLRAIISLQPVS